MGFFLSMATRKALDKIQNISNGVIKVQLSSQGKQPTKIHVLCVYAPTNAATPEERKTSTRFLRCTQQTYHNEMGFKSRMHHCLARRHYKRSVLDCKLVKPDALRSDHRLLMITTRLRYAKPKKTTVTERKDAAALKDPETRHALATEFKEI